MAARRGEDKPRTAEERSRALWWSCLSKLQQEQWRLASIFSVVGSHTGNRYWITNRPNYNVVDEKLRYCFTPSDHGLPVYDMMLAQKIALENDEQTVLLVANQSPLAGMMGAPPVIPPALLAPPWRR